MTPLEDRSSKHTAGECARDIVRRALDAADNGNHAGEVAVIAMANWAGMKAALRETRTDLVVLRGNVAHAANSEPRWEGMSDLVRQWIDRIDAALRLATEPTNER